MKASHYWQFVKLKATGQCIRETIANAREFFLQQFSATDALDAVPELTDLQIQKQLWQLRQNGNAIDRKSPAKIASVLPERYGLATMPMSAFLSSLYAAQRDRLIQALVLML
jgi:hypothetical protein